MSETQLLTGGRIYSPGSPDATAMAVTGGMVTWVGQDAPGRALHPNAEHLDLHGAFVAPAFVDAHVHATSAGLQLAGLDLAGCRSLAECLATLRTFVAAHPGAPVWGHGWEETAWPEARPPSRAELDAAAGDAAVYLSRIDVHSALVSTALLERAPQARDADGYHQDGPLSKQAHHHVRRSAQDSLTGEDRAAAQLAFLRHAAARGVACVHECAGPDISSPQDLTDLLTLASRTGTPEVIGYWGELGGVETARRLGAHGAGGDLFVDGALGSRTAALREPYADDPANSGARYLDAEQIAEHLVACTRAGMQAGFHVIGDAGIAEVVAAAELAAEIVGVPAMAARHHRLEHLEMINADDARRLAALGMIASMQPLFDAAWGGERLQYARRLGLPRGTTLNPFATVAASGMPLAFGSDAPVTPIDPWATVRAAVHHRTEGQGISPRAAFTAHTRGGWRAGGDQDGHTGTLVPGAAATYAVWDAERLVTAAPDSRVQRWSTDPRAGVPPLPDLTEVAKLPSCMRTVLRGEVIYNSAGSAP
ncbi:MAG: amidohydrolase [Sciscionella sp.]